MDQDTQIQPQLKRAESSKHVSTIRTPAQSTAQQMSRFSMPQNKIAYDLKEDRSPGEAGRALTQLRRLWKHTAAIEGPTDSNLMSGPEYGGEGNPHQNETPDQGTTTAGEVQASGQEAVTAAEDMYDNLSQDKDMQKSAAWAPGLVVLYDKLYAEAMGIVGRPRQKRAALPIGNVAANPASPTGPIQTPPSNGGLPPGMMAQQAGMPTGQGVAAGSPAGGPPPVSPAATPPSPTGSPPVGMQPPGGQPQGGQPPPDQGAQPPGQQAAPADPNAQGGMPPVPPPRPPSPIPHGEHLDTITPDNKSHPLNRLMDQAQQSEHATAPDEANEESEDTSTIGGGGNTRHKEAAEVASNLKSGLKSKLRRPIASTHPGPGVVSTATCGKTAGILDLPGKLIRGMKSLKTQTIVPRPLSNPTLAHAVPTPFKNLPVGSAVPGEVPTAPRRAFGSIPTPKQPTSDDRWLGNSLVASLGAGVAGTAGLHYGTKALMGSGNQQPPVENQVTPEEPVKKDASMKPIVELRRIWQGRKQAGLFDGQPSAAPPRRFMPSPGAVKPTSPMMLRGLGRGLAGGVGLLAGGSLLSSLWNSLKGSAAAKAPAQINDALTGKPQAPVAGQ